MVNGVRNGVYGFTTYDRECGQLFAVEGLIAALIMITAAYLAFGAVIPQSNADMHVSELQLKQIGDDLNVVCRLYSNDEDSELTVRYIVQHFEEALQNGWVRVYYQPILRTCTRRKRRCRKTAVTPPGSGMN